MRKKEQPFRRVLVSKKNYQYLGLLSVMLFSLSLAQAKPLNARAETSDELTKIVGGQSSQSDAHSSVNSFEKTTMGRPKSVYTTDGATGRQTSQTASSTAKMTQIETADAGKEGRKLPVSHTPKESVSSESTRTTLTSKTAGVAAPSSAVTPDELKPSQLVAIKNGDSSGQLDSQHKLSLNQATTSNSDNLVFDDTDQAATITGPTTKNTVTTVATVQAKPVIVRYFSSKGVLKKAMTLTGKLGESYNALVRVPKYKSGYTVNQLKWPKNAQGVFSDATTYVDYYYAAPVDSWKSYQDQTQINTVVNGDKKLMDLRVYYPNGAKVSVTITKNNQVRVYTLSPNGYATKTVTLAVGNTHIVENSDGTIHWIELLADGSIDLTYEYNHGKVNDRIDPNGTKLKHAFIKLAAVSVNTISEKESVEKDVQKISNGTPYRNGMNEKNRKASVISQNKVIIVTNTNHDKRAEFSTEQNNNSLLPQTNDVNGVNYSVLGLMGLLASLLGLGKFKKE